MNNYPMAGSVHRSKQLPSFGNRISGSVIDDDFRALGAAIDSNQEWAVYWRRGSCHSLRYLYAR